MGSIEITDLLDAGVHFGHQTKRWNPKMRPYIFGSRNGIYIIDLSQTVTLFERAETFVRDLAASGKLSSTLVLVLSEFGRTPRINSNAGRDHHARCFSCLIAGGGVRGGQVIGASDKDAMEPVERPVKPSDLHATVCHALGIDHEKEV